MYITVVPGTPVSELTAIATGASSVNVSWVPPPDDIIPGILIGYVVYFKTTSSNSDIWASRQVWNTDEPYAILELEAFTNYTIKVATVSLEGEGKAVSVNVSTEEGGKFVPVIEINGVVGVGVLPYENDEGAIYSLGSKIGGLVTFQREVVNLGILIP